MKPCHCGGLVGRLPLPFLRISEGGAILYRLFVGIDVSKDSSSARGLDPGRQSCFALSFPMDSAGFSALLEVFSPVDHPFSGKGLSLELGRFLELSSLDKKRTAEDLLEGKTPKETLSFFS